MPAFAEGPIPSPLLAVSPTALPGEAASRVDEVAAAFISGGLSREASTPNEGKAAKLDGALAANSLARTKAAGGTAGTDTKIALHAAFAGFVRGGRSTIGLRACARQKLRRAFLIQVGKYDAFGLRE